MTTEQILEREQCGICVEPERPELLAAAIERLADDEMNGAASEHE